MPPEEHRVAASVSSGDEERRAGERDCCPRWVLVRRNHGVGAQLADPRESLVRSRSAPEQCSADGYVADGQLDGAEYEQPRIGDAGVSQQVAKFALRLCLGTQLAADDDPRLHPGYVAGDQIGHRHPLWRALSAPYRERGESGEEQHHDERDGPFLNALDARYTAQQVDQPRERHEWRCQQRADPANHEMFSQCCTDGQWLRLVQPGRSAL